MAFKNAKKCLILLFPSNYQLFLHKFISFAPANEFGSVRLRPSNSLLQILDFFTSHLLIQFFKNAELFGSNQIWISGNCVFGLPEANLTSWRQLSWAGLSGSRQPFRICAFLCSQTSHWLNAWNILHGTCALQDTARNYCSEDAQCMSIVCGARKDVQKRKSSTCFSASGFLSMAHFFHPLPFTNHKWSASNKWFFIKSPA